MGVVADFNDKIAFPICSVDLLTCDEFEAFDGRENFFGQLHKTDRPRLLWSVNVAQVESLARLVDCHFPPVCALKRRRCGYEVLSGAILCCA